MRSDRYKYTVEVSSVTALLSTISQANTPSQIDQRVSLMMAVRGCLTAVFTLLLISGVHPEPKQAPPQGVSPRLLTFISALSGVYNDGEEVNEEKKFADDVVLDSISVNYRPFFIPALGGPVIYLEEDDSGTVFRKMLLSVSENVDGAIVMVQYNITGSSSWNFDDLDTLSNIKKEDLEVSPPECNVFYTQLLDNNIFIGAYPDCYDTDKSKQHPVYAITVTCNGLAVLNSSPFSREKAALEPYICPKLKSYPIPPELLKNAPGFQDPCQK